MPHLKVGASVNKRGAKDEGDTAEVSFDEITLLFVRGMRLHGLLPLAGRRFDYLPTYGLLCYYLTSSLISWSMLLTNFVRSCFQNKPDLDPVAAICEIVLVIGFNVRYYLLIGRRREYAEMLDECRSIWNQCDSHERIMIVGFTRKVRILFFFLLLSGIGVVVLYAATALTTRIPSSSPSSSSNNVTLRRVLPYKWYVDNPDDHWPSYTAIFVLQTLIVCNSSCYLSTVDTAIPLLIMLCSGFLRSASNRFYNVTNENDDEFDGQTFIVDCFKFHQRILNLCSSLEKFARSIFLTQILCTCYNLSLFAIKLASTDPNRLKYLPMLTMCLGQLFICQWTSNYLLDESLEVATAACSAAFGWTRRSVAKLSVIVIARAQTPVQMTAGGFIYLSLESYGHMMTSAVSFFTVLRNFNI